jgi:heavy metal translocating P-type ATPase
VSARAYPPLAALALGAIVTGLALAAGGRHSAATVVWTAVVVVLLVPLLWSVVVTLAHGRLGVDAIALVAMAGALALGEVLAGAVIALMLAGGNALEAVADRRARRELTALLERSPTVAQRRHGDELVQVPVAEIVPGDVLVIRQGDVVPVDGTVLSDSAVVDESLPATYARGEPLRSGIANAGEAFDLRALRPAAQSAYAALVSLVEQAQADRAPFTRMADRYAALLLPVTLVVAGAAWAFSGDALRALAVVVVATPCPLILAAPIALVSGVSRAAAAGIVVKGASVIEQLGRVRSVLLDKTGTLTLGTPRIVRIDATGDVSARDALRLAASLDQLSAHPLAAALVRAANEDGLPLSLPDHVHEQAGHGIVGQVGGRRVALGRAAAGAGDVPIDERGLARIGVDVDGRPVATIVMGDHVREDAAPLVTALRAGGVAHIAMVTGDRAEIADPVGKTLALDRVYADCSPQDKLDVVRSVRARGDLRPVMMVGDGVNDAPALAMADVGIAMGGPGATASSEAADAVITSSTIGAVATAVQIGRRSLRIATQSVLVGMGLSFAAMGFAAAGFLPPVAGALLQEGIDVAVILNALRARTG